MSEIKNYYYYYYYLKLKNYLLEITLTLYTY